MAENTIAAPSPLVRPDYRLGDSLVGPGGAIFLTGTQALVRLHADAAPARCGGRPGHARLHQRLPRLAAGHGRPGRVEGRTAVRGSRASAFCRPSTRSWAPRRCSARSVSRPTPSAPAPACSRCGTARAPAWTGPATRLKHGNAYGASPHGGVLMVAGDDHGCVSSSMPHQSDQAFQAWHAPIVAPASVAEYLEFGLYGWALSRFSGNWVGFTALSEVVESASTVDLDLVNARAAAWQDARHGPPGDRLRAARPADCITAGPTCPRSRSSSACTPSSMRCAPSRASTASTGMWSRARTRPSASSPRARRTTTSWKCCDG